MSFFGNIPKPLFFQKSFSFQRNKGFVLVWFSLLLINLYFSKDLYNSLCTFLAKKVPKMLALLMVSTFAYKIKAKLEKVGGH